MHPPQFSLATLTPTSPSQTWGDLNERFQQENPNRDDLHGQPWISFGFQHHLLSDCFVGGSTPSLLGFGSRTQPLPEPKPKLPEPKPKLISSAYEALCAHLWNKIGNTLKRKMLRISFQDVKCDLQEEKTETTTYATGLVNLKHRLHNEMHLTNATALAASVHDAEASIYTLENDIRESRSRLAALQV